MIDSYWVVRDSDRDIAHYGVKGMKWGVRRHQNEDETLTSLGRRREELKDAQQRHVKAMIRNAGITFAKVGGLGYAVNTGIRSVNPKFERSIVRRYRKEHPNSEILKSLNVT